MTVEIAVTGSHSVSLPPQEATVHLTVGADGAAPEPVTRLVAATLEDVRASLESRHHPDRGPVTRYAIDQIRTGSHRPYNRDGVQLPPVHTAAVSATATFTDFDELATWVGWATALDGLGIGYIAWALTDADRLRAEREVRQEAVRDARRRAQDYADALDLGPVQVRSIGDPGLSPQPHPKVMMARAMADPAGDAPQFTLRPEDVVIDAQVQATFVVGVNGE